MIGDKGCIGKTEQEGICDAGECPFWNEWESWSDCSESCGTGLRERSRSCQYGLAGYPGCEGSDQEIAECSPHPCPFLTDWKETECSKTCGGGKIARSRSCVHYVPGVHECKGETSELLDCNTQTCPHWADWAEFQPCSLTCGVGEKRRRRECLDGLIGQDGCNSNDFEDVAPCNTFTCPFWLNWSDWSPCDRTCSKLGMRGQSKRSRSCMFGNQVR